MAFANVLETVREDDYVEYYLFPDINGNDNGQDNEHVSLNNYLTKVNSIVERLSKDYLWHKDKFDIISKPASSHVLQNDEFQSKETLPPHLYGVSHFGDNIEDEWFLVFLLLQLTKEIDGLIIRVIDSDGEFLLIEAANFLPSWANPETCEKRIYLYKGQLHLIPSSQASIDVNIALATIRRDHLLTEASTNIQKAIYDRIQDYPEKIIENLHRAKVYVPVGVAAVLNSKPELIAPAILAFCNRDPIDMKALRAMKYFPPENRVYSSVTFTKCLFAMLSHSNYQPDRRIGWNLPDVKNTDFKSHSLGVKIACGFEILVSQAKPAQDLENDKKWLQYLKTLKTKDYFRDLLEHSHDYNNLLNNAKDYFKLHKSEEHSKVTVGAEILELNKSLGYNYDDFKRNEPNLPPDDDESWLNINPIELEKMLVERYGQNKFFNVNGSTNPVNFTEKLTQFLNHTSDIDGAEFPQENRPESPPIRPQRGIKRGKDKTRVSFSKDTKITENTENKINFDPTTFSCAVQNILDLVIPDDSWDLESGSEMSEYGDEAEMDLDKMDSTSKINSKIQEYMEEMDRELAGTTIGQSFEKKTHDNDGFDDIETFKPVDIDMTALKNILESYQSQMGAAGPASNMLGPMGVHLEPSSSTSQKFD